MHFVFKICPFKGSLTGRLFRRFHIVRGGAHQEAVEDIESVDPPIVPEPTDSTRSQSNTGNYVLCGDMDETPCQCEYIADSFSNAYPAVATEASSINQSPEKELWVAESSPMGQTAGSATTSPEENGPSGRKRPSHTGGTAWKHGKDPIAILADTFTLPEKGTVGVRKHDSSPSCASGSRLSLRGQTGHTCPTEFSQYEVDVNESGDSLKVSGNMVVSERGSIGSSRVRALYGDAGDNAELETEIMASCGNDSLSAGGDALNFVTEVGESSETNPKPYRATGDVKNTDRYRSVQESVTHTTREQYISQVMHDISIITRELQAAPRREGGGCNDHLIDCALRIAEMKDIDLLFNAVGSDASAMAAHDAGNYSECIKSAEAACVSSGDAGDSYCPCFLSDDDSTAGVHELSYADIQRFFTDGDTSVVSEAAIFAAVGVDVPSGASMKPGGFSQQFPSVESRTLVTTGSEPTSIASKGMPLTSLDEKHAETPAAGDHISVVTTLKEHAPTNMELDPKPASVSSIKQYEKPACLGHGVEDDDVMKTVAVTTLKALHANVRNKRQICHPPVVPIAAVAAKPDNEKDECQRQPPDVVRPGPNLKHATHQQSQEEYRVFETPRNTVVAVREIPILQAYSDEEDCSDYTQGQITNLGRFPSMDGVNLI